MASDMPLVRINNFNEMTDLGRIRYSIEWCEAGEKLVGACLRHIREHLE